MSHKLTKNKKIPLHQIKDGIESSPVIGKSNRITGAILSYLLVCFVFSFMFLFCMHICTDRPTRYSYTQGITITGNTSCNGVNCPRKLKWESFSLLDCQEHDIFGLYCSICSGIGCNQCNEEEQRYQPPSKKPCLFIPYTPSSSESEEETDTEDEIIQGIEAVQINGDIIAKKESEEDEDIDIL